MSTGQKALRVAQAIFLSIIIYNVYVTFMNKPRKAQSALVQVKDCVQMDPWRNRCVTYMAEADAIFPAPDSTRTK